MTYRCLLIDPAARRPELDAELARRGLRATRVPAPAAACALLAQWRFDALVGVGPAAPWPGPASRGGVPLLVQADGGEPAALRALEGGASDCLPLAAAARLVALKLLRLVECAAPRAPEQAGLLRVGSLWLDARRGIAEAAGMPLALSPGEFELLRALACRPGEIVRRAVLAAARGASERGARTLDARVCRLRRLLDAAGAHDLALLTVYGIGYCLSPRRIDPGPAQSVQRPAAIPSLA